MQLGFKNFNYLAVALSWLVFANHCIVGDSLARLSPRAYHCHDEGDSDGHQHNQESSNHHSKCKGGGCCQPALESSTSFLSQDASNVPILTVTLNQYIIELHSPTSIEYLSLFEGMGPPDTPKILVSSLYSAPNAPPLSSSYC